jgi:hypothetical protein
MQGIPCNVMAKAVPPKGEGLAPAHGKLMASIAVATMVLVTSGLFILHPFFVQKNT